MIWKRLNEELPDVYCPVLIYTPLLGNGPNECYRIAERVRDNSWYLFPCNGDSGIDTSWIDAWAPLPDEPVEFRIVPHKQR